MFDVVLREKCGTEGLTKNEATQMIAALSEATFFPLKLEAKNVESSAMGFITVKAADVLWYDYERSGFHDFIASILDYTENDETGIYQFQGLKISLCR